MTESLVTRDAEQALVGAIVAAIAKGPAAAAIELAHVRGDMDAHELGDMRARAVFEGLVAVADSGGTLSLVSLGAALEGITGALKVAGGPAGLRELAALARPGERASLLARVHDHAKIRRAAGRCAKLATLGSTVIALENPDRYLAAVASVATDAKGKLRSRTTTASAGVHAAWQAFTNRGRVVQAAPYGIDGLDDLLDAGLQRKRLYVVGARPGVGKSALMTLGIVASARQGHPCLVFSREMSASQLWSRAIVQASRIDAKRWQRGPNVAYTDEIRSAVEVSSWLSDLPVEIDTDTHDIGAMLARASIWLEVVARPLLEQDRSGTLNDGATVSRLVPRISIDYLQRSGLAGDFASREERVGAITNLLAKFSRDEDCAIELLSQINRSSVKDQRPPRAEDLRESGSIEQDADTIIFLHREIGAGKDADAPKKLEQDASIIVDKNREGDTGWVPATWHGSTMRYTDRARPDHYTPEEHEYEQSQ